MLLIFVMAGIVASFHWATNNQDQAQATGDSVIGAGAAGIQAAANGFKNFVGGSAAEAGGVQVIMVQNEAPLRWHVGGAMRVWNAGLTNVQLKAGDCVDGLQCIKISQVSDLPPQDGRMVLGRTSTFFGTSIRFNGAAVGHVPARSLAVAACHELGHALGAEHRTVTSSCMDAVIGPGVSTRPDKTDYAKVNDKYGP
ncbi:MAG TPA: matrixin family metalloprotease [Streptosporangiaceae bacterium]